MLSDGGTKRIPEFLDGPCRLGDLLQDSNGTVSTRCSSAQGLNASAGSSGELKGVDQSVRS